MGVDRTAFLSEPAIGALRVQGGEEAYFAAVGAYHCFSRTNSM